MARNKDAIHILRGKTENLRGVIPTAGQPLYDKDKNILYIGDGTNSPDGKLKAITVADRAIVSVKIGQGEVKEENLARDAVTVDKIKNGSVTSAKIGQGEVKTDNIEDNAVKSGKIGYQEVKTTNIANGAVTTDKLYTASVTINKVLPTDTGNGLGTKFVTRDTAQTISDIKTFVQKENPDLFPKTAISVSGMRVYKEQNISTGYSHSYIARTNNGDYFEINLPSKAGTFALTSDTVNMTGNQTGIAGDKSFIGNLSTTGNITAKTFYATSDERLKENITDYKSEKSILDIPVKEYNFIGDDKKHIGFIAQDLQKVFPELVTEKTDGYLAIEESKLIYLLIDEVKKLREKVGD